MTEHRFNTEHAEKYGLTEAIILHNLIFWISTNKANNTHEHLVTDGDYVGESRTWTYNSVKAFGLIFHYLTPKKIRVALENLQKDGVIIKGNFSKDKTERTNWYALANESEFIPERLLKGQMDLPYMANGNAPQGKSIYTDTKHTNKKHNISSDEEPNNTSDLVSVNCTQQNIDANCTLPIVDSTKPIYKVKKKETQPKDELKSKFRKDFEELWNKAGKEKMTNIGYIAINRLYEKYGYDKACFIRDYVIELYGSNERSIAYNKNHENALAFYKDPNDEQPRYLNDKWKTMQRFSRPNAEEPVVFDFPMEDALYAAWEWYYHGKGFSGSELVKKVREKIKEINHSRFNKY